MFDGSIVVPVANRSNNNHRIALVFLSERVNEQRTIRVTTEDNVSILSSITTVTFHRYILLLQLTLRNHSLVYLFTYSLFIRISWKEADCASMFSFNTRRSTSMATHPSNIALERAMDNPSYRTDNIEIHSNSIFLWMLNRWECTNRDTQFRELPVYICKVYLQSPRNRIRYRTRVQIILLR